MQLTKLPGLDRLSRFHRVDHELYGVTTSGDYNQFSAIYKIEADNSVTPVDRSDFLLALLGPAYERIQAQFSTGLEHYAIAKDLQGNFWLHFYQDVTIFKYTAQGALVDEIAIDFGKGHFIYDIKMGIADSLWLAFPSGHTVAQLDLRTKALVETIGVFHWGDDPAGSKSILSYPESLWVDAGQLFIPNMGNHKLFVRNLADESLRCDLVFEESLWHYTRVNDREYVTLQSGTYALVR